MHGIQHWKYSYLVLYIFAYLTCILSFLSYLTRLTLNYLILAVAHTRLIWYSFNPSRVELFGFRVYSQITNFQSGDPLPDESLWSHFDTRDAFKRHAILHLETRIIIKSTQSKHCCVMTREKPIWCRLTHMSNVKTFVGANNLKSR